MSPQFKHLRALLVLVVLGCFALDMLLCTLMLLNLEAFYHRGEAFVVFGAVIGLLVGQAVLAASWLALGAGPLSIRVPTSLAILALVIFSWFVGASLSNNLPSLEYALLTAAFCFILFLSVTAPLWITRHVSRRRIIALDSPRGVESREQFSLRYVLIVTACVAVFLSLAKSIFDDGSWNGSIGATWRSMITILIMVFAFGAYITLVVLPLLWIILRKPRGTFLWLWVVVGTLVLFPFLVSEVFFAIPGIGRPPNDLYAWVIGSPLAFGFAVVLVTSGGFWAARSLGLRFLSAEARGIDLE